MHAHIEMCTVIWNIFSSATVHYSCVLLQRAAVRQAISIRHSLYTQLPYATPEAHGSFSNNHRYDQFKSLLITSCKHADCQMLHYGSVPLVTPGDPLLKGKLNSITEVSFVKQTLTCPAAAEFILVHSQQPMFPCVTVWPYHIITQPSSLAHECRGSQIHRYILSRHEPSAAGTKQVLQVNYLLCTSL